MEEYLKDNFAFNLKRLRKKRGLTLEQLADRINKEYNTKVNESMISKWENGYEADISTVKTLSLYFDINLNELLGFNVKDSIIDNKPIRDYKIPNFEIGSLANEQSLEEKI